MIVARLREQVAMLVLGRWHEDLATGALEAGVAIQSAEEQETDAVLRCWTAGPLCRGCYHTASYVSMMPAPTNVRPQWTTYSHLVSTR